VIRRNELPDAEWEFVRPLLPVSLRGRKRLDDWTVLNGRDRTSARVDLIAS
jgi:transposase